MTANGAISANTISVVNSIANTDLIILVRAPSSNTWSLKGIAANSLGISANVTVGSNVLHIVNGLIISIT